MSKENWNEAWYRNLRLVVFLANAFLVAAIAALGYLLLEDQFLPRDSSFAVDSNLQKNKQENTGQVKEDSELVENGIHVATGLVYAEGFDLVRATCTGCHSAQLITQNRATRSGWESMIRWMQRTQGLWELGSQEAPILDYLAAHYAPSEVGRRANLDIEAIEWFVLDLE